MDEAAMRAAGGSTAGDALSALRWVWGVAYEIWNDGEGWYARRLDRRGGVLTAETPGELSVQILDDYRGCPVRRPLAVQEGQ